MKLLLVLLCCVGFIQSNTLSAQKNKIVVVIDPGHGGHDPGHLSSDNSHLPEKDLNLKISNYLGSYIEKYLQNVEVIFTRTTDVYPNLDQRVDKANHNNADYFLSIHCNGNERNSVHGTESHVHSLSLNKSVAFANEIEKQFSQRAGRKSRGVKDERDLQHSLQVLKYTNMPSVLVECGFVTNPREASFLNSTYGQEIIASAIFRGFRSTIENDFPTIAFRRTIPQENNSDVAVNGASLYCIQIMSSKSPVSTEDNSFSRLKMPVKRKELNTSSAYKYIYTVGEYNSKKEAKNELALVQSIGFKDAIIIKR